MPNSKIATPSDPAYVFVELYVMLGDADGSIEGFAVLTKEKWEANIAKFEKNLAKKGISQAEVDTEWGLAEVDLENYEVKPCTSEEMATLQKFLPSSDDHFLVESGNFKLPTDFLR